MNVLWLVSWFPNRTDLTSGDFIERHAKAVAPFVNQLTIIFITKEEAMHANAVEIEKHQEANITVYKAYYGGLRLKGIIGKVFSQRKYRQLQWQLFNEFAELQGVPDIVHVHVAMKAGIFACDLKKKYGISFIVTEHWSGYFKESKPNIYDMGKLYQRLNSKVLKNASLLLPVTENLAETITENFVRLPFKVVPNVVDTTIFFYQPSKPEIFTFIHPSYMDYSKNPEGILEGCRLLKNKGYKFRLYMIGNRPPLLLELAKEYYLDETVFFVDHISYKEVALRMQQASALLMFSRYESLPCIILEALCCGLPVVSSRVGGIAEVVDRKNGLLVDKDSTEDLVNAMEQVIEHYSNYNRPAIAAFATEKFSYNTVGTTIYKAYEALLNKK